MRSHLAAWMVGGTLAWICAASGRAQAPAANGIVARVNGNAILLSDVETMAEGDLASVQAFADSGAWTDGYRRALTLAVDETLLVQKAQSEGIQVDDAEIATRIDQQLGATRRMAEASGMELDQWLAASDLNVEGLRRARIEIERRRALVDRLIDSQVTIAPAELEAFRRQRRQEGLPVEMASLSQILVPCPAADQPTTEGRRLYREALQAAREAGQSAEKFHQWVGPAGADGQAPPRAVDLGWIDPATLRPALREAVSRMKPGEVCSPVATADGYHVLLLRQRLTTDQLFYQRQYDKAREQLAARLRADAHIQLYDQQGNPLRPEDVARRLQPPASQTEPTPPPAPGP